VRHTFPADGEYKFSIQNFGIGSFIPGEQLELTIDGERAHLFKYQGVGTSQGMSGEGDGSLDVTIPVKAGSRVVGATFLATNYRPSLDTVKQYDRKSLENNSIPQLQYYPAIGFLRIQGPFTAQRPTDSRSIRKVFTCRPSTSSGRPAPVAGRPAKAFREIRPEERQGFARAAEVYVRYTRDYRAADERAPG